MSHHAIAHTLWGMVCLPPASAVVHTLRRMLWSVCPPSYSCVYCALSDCQLLVVTSLEMPQKYVTPTDNNTQRYVNTLSVTE